MGENIYTSGEYLQNNPTLDIEDTPWKLTKLMPLVDAFMQASSQKELTVLDVGGGAGLILKGIVEHLRQRNTLVTQYVLDLSDEMLSIQKKNNPEIARVVKGDISETAFEDKSIDLVLMIDVLEHLGDIEKTLKELSRISRYVIFKVPLEDNLFFNMLDRIKRGGLRRDIIDKVGHINSFNYRTLNIKLTEYAGTILCYSFTDVFSYYLSKDYYRQIPARERIVYRLGRLAFFVSPSLCSRLFSDSVVCLVKCR